MHTFSRRDCLQTSAAGLLGLTFSAGRGLAQQADGDVGTNWAGNVKFSAKKIFRPKTRGDLQQIVRENRAVKAVGGRHSFSRIADTEGALVSPEHFDDLAIDRNRSTVAVGAGVKYSQLCPHLEQQGYALENLASLPHICIAGAVATATHGSGTGNLATQVVGIEFVNGRGEIVSLNQRDEAFQGAVVNLGGIGLVIQVLLRIEPKFEVRQWVWEHMPLANYLEHFDDIIKAGYSVCTFTDYQKDDVAEIWVKRRASAGDWSPGARWFGATPAPRDRHPIAAMDPTPCTKQMGVPGPAWERLPHFRPDHPPSSKGKERHSEYFVDIQDAKAAIRALYAVGPQIARALQIAEIRTVRADELWMSTAHGRDSVALHFTWTDNDAHVELAMPVVEAALVRFSPRAHWGKMHTLSEKQVTSGFKRISDFRELCRKHDPDGKFRNAYLAQNVFG
jgi:xylitol oxidase